MPELEMLPEHMFSMIPGTCSSCCIDDYDVAQSDYDLYALPIRAMKSVNGEYLLCLILRSVSENSRDFRREGLLALRKNELDGFDWAMGEWHNGSDGLHLNPQAIRLL
ncbi:hypothetical protein AYO21_02999 [Fonsecaea monophora]|uniref:Uncharacterized protein n=1 Tax=Fonsecaea monophora TaxID=254056 RepID=A0A177FG75_9EURO|nr:hypothetical protein AYO21_02999 [Fonsecaea monophora]OAG42716.1 hypothetical protein AYO21_02999 [Fonsecaea monophora]